ncbi:hypothetical protein AAVH_02962 [Aphelenchoides avenae]|nr:hypothetical protein AAVH_02962 [Aphelenchus avenae]
MSLAALKNFLELLFGRSSIQPQEPKDRNSSKDDSPAPQLPEALWIVAWTTEESATNNPENKHYIPGQFHLTTLLNVFPPLFQRVRRQIPAEEMRFHNEIVSVPISAEQAPFILNSQNSEINPTQECILECVKVVFQEESDPQSKMRPALPDLLRLLLQFVRFSIQPPTSKFVATMVKENQLQWAQQNLIAFAELSLRTAVEYFAKVSNTPECIHETVLIDFIKSLAEPLALKYQCPSQTTWKIAASSLSSVCRIGLPTARENSHLFTPLWPHLASTIEGFLFSTSPSSVPLNADERKRHEFVDCQMIELIRMEILPYANQLPRDFMQRIIDILNRGSINTIDPNDVLDSFEQRADLSRVCFDALLSMSRTQAPDIVQAASGGVVRGVAGSTGPSQSLGDTAIASLLHRCKQVLNNYARDEQGCGHFRLPQGRIFEVISVLRAISALIDGLAKHPEAVHSTLYSHLVNLYPCLVQLIPSCRSDQQVELALMTCLNSYQTLLLINVHTSAGVKDSV